MNKVRRKILFALNNYLLFLIFLSGNVLKVTTFFIFILAGKEKGNAMYVFHCFSGFFLDVASELLGRQ